MRLLPRFSLRFAWIALTIFLLVFGFGASRWKRASEHDASIERLLAGEYAIEEDEVSWAGHLPEKRVIGLISSVPCGETELQAFLDFPRPWELRGLSLSCTPLKPETQEKLFAQLERCTALEQLHLPALQLTKSQAQRLSALVKLRVLNLRGSTVPAGSQAFLRALPDLEILVINGNGYSLEQWETLPATKLRVLQLSDCAGPELRLTKAGFGRYSQLETLTFELSPFALVSCEAGALPRLEVLSIPDVAKPDEIAWLVLPEAAPQLRALAIHPTQFNFTSRAQFEKMPQLRRLMLFAMTHQNTKGLTWASFNQSWVLYRDYFKPELEEFVQTHPRILIDLDYRQFLSNVLPAELDLAANANALLKPHWKSNSWLKPSLAKRSVPLPFAPPGFARGVPSATPVLAPRLPSPAPTFAPDPFAPAPVVVAAAVDPFAPAPTPPPEPAWLKDFGPERD